MKIYAVVELDQPENMSMNSYQFAQTVLGGANVLFTATGYEGVEAHYNEFWDPKASEITDIQAYFRGNVQHGPSYAWSGIIDYGDGNIGDQFYWTGSISDAERHFYTAIPDITGYGNFDNKESDDCQETIALHYWRPYADVPDETQTVTVYLSRTLTP